MVDHSAFRRLSEAVAGEADRRLRTDIVGWLTTVDPQGTPTSSVVSFLWDGRTILFYSEPDTPKIRNLAANPRVSFHLNCDEIGDQMVTLEGDCRVDEDAPRSSEISEYQAKYAEPCRRWGMDPGDTAEQFWVACRITLDRIRAW
jgi:PPOX class probable F420-dependent enzyme